MLDTLRAAVSYGEKLGADFVEARFDDLTLRTLRRINDTWKDIILKSRTGVGITCYYDATPGYSFTASEDQEDVYETVKRAYKMAKAASTAASLKLDFDERPAVKSRPSDTFTAKVHPRTQDLDFKMDLINRMVESAREVGKDIQNVTGRYGELFGKKIFTNSEGSDINWDFLVIDLPCRVTSKTSTGALVFGSERKAGTLGLEIYKQKGFTPEEIGKAAGKYAAEQITAKACPAGKFTALTDNDLTGVLAHESFGHLSEADFVVMGMSPLVDKIGSRLGTKHTTIIDGGVPNITKHGGLWIPYDDQGTKANMTTILDKGILRHYLQNRGTAKNLNQEPTSNCRAVHFGFIPIPRMTNTYFMPGDLTEEEALEQLGTGIYAIQTSGGQVEGDGSFLFKADRGYWVEQGKIQHPIREVSLSGNILQLLTQVEGATRDLLLWGTYFGGCGKDGQHPLPCGLGGPKLLIKDVTFGGQA
ncbi:MAG: TldD/PmbA family protein [Candidatus Odinarchaeota archaeon]